MLKHMSQVHRWLFLVALLTFTLGSEAWSADKAAPVESKPAQSAVVAPTTQPVTNKITEAAAKAGVVTCLPRINQITNFVTANAKSGALIFPVPAAIDKKQFSVSLEVENPANGAASYVTTSFSPAADGSCSGSYESVTYWSNPCDEVATKVFPNFKSSGRPLSQQIKALEGPSSTRVFLMPAANGCIAIKKEIVY